MRDFYYASGWFSEEQEKNYSKLTSILKEKYTLFEPRNDAGVVDNGEKLTIKRAKEIFKKDLGGIDNCKYVFCDVSFHDTGTIFELAWSIAKGKDKVYLFNNRSPKINLMLFSAVDGYFINFEQVEHFVKTGEVPVYEELELE